MTARAHHEAHLSQVPAIALLQKLGWRVLTREEALRERRGRLGNVLLEDVLAERLHAINRVRAKGVERPFSEANVLAAIERLKAARASSPFKTNEDVTDLLQLGTALDQTVEGETRAAQLRYVDWDEPANNAFHAVPEFEVERAGGKGTRRPDLVLFVNGVPFAVIECKAPGEDVAQGVSQLIGYQDRDEVPQLFASVQLLVAVNRNEARYATAGTAAKFWSRWRELEDDPADLERVLQAPLTPGQTAAAFAGGFAEGRGLYEAAAAGGLLATEQDRALHALCRPERLLDLARRFTLFDGGVKKVARYQQFFAVRRVLARVEERDAEGRRRGGVVWHTQGSGKSLTMVMLARALAMALPTARVVMVTDRVDLDKQLVGTFAACGLEPVRAATGRHLLQLVGRDRARVVTALIHKFAAALKAQDFADPSPDVFLLVDEGHRSQHGGLHNRMRKLFPNACYVGFTGTPLLKREKSTFERFGGVIRPAYTMRDGVEDKAVVPLLYEGRVVERRAHAEALDAWFERACEGLGDDAKAELKRKLATPANLAKSRQTVACVAWDVREHWLRGWSGTGFKGQLVAPDKRTALLYKEMLDGFGGVTSEVVISAPDDREGNEVVGDDPRDEVRRFWKRTMERFGNEEAYLERVTEGFKKREEPELLIVVDKLLTGFDAPRNAVLYLCRRLKEHGLLQAIARVNRVEDGKEFGHVIDYEGVLENLDRALTAYDELAGYDEADLEGAVAPIRAEVDKLPLRHAELWGVFKAVPNKLDREAMERHLADVPVRDGFHDRLKAFAASLKVALTSFAFANDPRNARLIEGYKRDLLEFRALRDSIARRYQSAVDFGPHEAKLRGLLDEHVEAHAVTRLTPLVDVFDSEAFARAVAGQASGAAKADLIASATARTLAVRMEEDPAHHERLSELVERAIADFRAGRIDEVEYLQRAEGARDRLVERADRRALPAVVRDDGTAAAIFGRIEPLWPDDDGTGRERAARTAKALADIVAARRVVGWAEREDVQNTMRDDMDDHLYGRVRDGDGVELSAAAVDEIVEAALQIARRREGAAP